MVGGVEEKPALTLMRVGEWRQQTCEVRPKYELSPGAVVGIRYGS